MSEHEALKSYSDGVRTLRIPVRLINELRRYESGRVARENGGILLGHNFANHDEIIKVGKPSLLDKAGKLFFIRKMVPAQRKINKAWQKSMGSLIYLGEWHTHPRNFPNPSEQDRTMIQRILVTTKMEINHIYLLIAGAGKSLWIGRQDTDGLKMLSEESPGL